MRPVLINDVTGRIGVLWYGPVHGHAYAAMQEFGCPRDAVWVGLNAQTTTAGAVKDGRPHLVRVWGLCRSRATGARTGILLGDKPSTAQSAGPDSNYPQSCPAIAFADEDDGKQFGLPSPVNGEDLVNRLLVGMAITGITIDAETADLSLLFEGNIRLDAFNYSAGYEGWQINLPPESGGMWVIAWGAAT